MLWHSHWLKGLFVFGLLISSPGLLAQTAPAPASAALSPDQFVSAVEAMEVRPFSQAAHDIRPTLLVWFRQSNRVKVDVCVEEAPLMGEDSLSNVLLSQVLLEDAAAQIRQPGITAQDSQLAGLMAMLRIYQGLRLRGQFNAYADQLQRELSQSGVSALIPHTCAGSDNKSD